MNATGHFVDVKDVRAGDVGLSKLSGFWTGLFVKFGIWAIGDGWNPPVQHAFVVLKPDAKMGIEATPGGARFMNLTDRPDALYLRLDGVDDAKSMEIAEQAAALWGTPYSFLDYAALALCPAPGSPLDRFVSVPGLRWLGNRLRARVKSSSHLICSQLVDLAASRAGVELFSDERLAGDVSPGDLYRLSDWHRAAK